MKINAHVPPSRPVCTGGHLPARTFFPSRIRPAAPRCGTFSGAALSEIRPRTLFPMRGSLHSTAFRVRDDGNNKKAPSSRELAAEQMRSSLKELLLFKSTFFSYSFRLPQKRQTPPSWREALRSPLTQGSRKNAQHFCGTFARGARVERFAARGSPPLTQGSHKNAQHFCGTFARGANYRDSIATHFSPQNSVLLIGKASLESRDYRGVFLYKKGAAANAAAPFFICSARAHGTCRAHGGRSFFPVPRELTAFAAPVAGNRPVPHGHSVSVPSVAALSARARSSAPSACSAAASSAWRCNLR